MPVYNTSPFQKRIFQQNWNNHLVNYALFKTDDGFLYNEIYSRWQQLTAAHDILKTQFKYNDDFKHPFQDVDESKTAIAQAVNCQEMDEQQIIAEHKNSCINSNGSVQLTIFADDQLVKYIGICGPVTLLDNWSVNYIIYTLTADAFDAGSPLQYTQYVEWLEGVLEEPAIIPSELTNLWTVNNHPAKLTLQTSSPALNWQNYASVAIKIPTTAIQQAAESMGVTARDVLWMAWRFLLSQHYLGQQWSIGWVSSGRQFDEFRQILGPFSKSISVNVNQAGLPDINEPATWAEKTELIESYQDYFDPYVHKPGNDFINTEIEYLDHNLYPANWIQNKITQVDALYCSEPFALKLVITQKQQLSATIEYDTYAFQPQAIQAIASQLHQLISHIAAGHSMNQLTEVPLADEQTKSELLTSAAKGLVTDIAFTPLTSILHNLSLEIPQKTALQFNSQILSYQDLYANAKAIAGALITQHGVKPGQFIAIQLTPGFELIQCIWAVMLAGAAYIPLDTQYPAGRVTHVLESSKAHLLITDTPESQSICSVVTPQQLEQQPNSEVILPEWKPEQVVYVIYTSGTTGNPKGCKITMDNLLHYLKWAQGYYFSQGQGGNFPLFTSIAFDLTVTSVFSTLTTGGTLTIASPDEPVATQLQNIFNGIYAVNAVKLTPSHIRMLAHINTAGSTISTCIVGGEAMQPQDVAILRSINPEMHIFNEYGPTECTVGCIVWQVPQLFDAIHIGKPIDNASVYILDSQDRLCPPGIAGELYISGKTVGAGYLNNPGQTTEKFIPSPFNTNETLYKTGDTGYWLTDGNINYLGRNDDMVKIRGFRVDMNEILNLLSNSPLVKQAYVSNFPAGDNSEQIIAYYIPVDNDTDSSSDLFNMLRLYLPEYMLPAHILPVDSFPLTVNGKLDKNLLPTPEEVNKKSKQEFVAPRNADEQLMADIWKQVLHLDEVGVNDHFLSIGGDSIKAIQVVARLRDHNLQVSIRNILLYPTIAELVLHLNQNSVDAESDLSNGASVELTPIQIKFLKDSQHNGSHYNQSILLGSTIPVDAQKLQICITRLWQHHHMLRARYNINDSLPQQEVMPANTQCDYFITLDGKNIAEHDQQAWIMEQTTQLQQSFKLNQVPLFRCVLMRFNHYDVVFLLAHHLIIDGVSWRILLDDLTRLYQDEHSVLSPSASFKQWSTQVRQLAATGFADDEITYWQSIEQAFDKKLYFNNKYTEQVHQHYSYLNVSLPADETGQLLDIGSSHTSMQDILLAALAKTLYLWTKQGQSVIYLESHGRNATNNAEAYAATIGWFTTKYPFLLKYNPADDIEQRLTAVKTALNKVPGHGSGYLIDKYLSPATKLNSQAEPTFSFNYLGSLDIPRDQDFFIHPLSEQQQNIGASVYIPSTVLFTLIISGGSLQIGVSYHNYLYEQYEIELLQHNYINHLREIIRNYIAQSTNQNTGNNFDYKGLDQNELNDIINLL